jgi:FG-GAP-like repeat
MVSARAFLGAVLLLVCPRVSAAVSGSPPPLGFVRHDIISQNPGLLSEGFDVGDLDRDGRPDMIEGGETSLLWYHNPDWTPRPIATGFRYAAGAAIAVTDIDGDGRLDVVTGRYPLDQPGSRQMLWFANTASGWVEHVLSSTAFCHDMAFGDLDGDGRADVLCADQFREQVLWLGAPADPTTPWTSHVLDEVRPMGAALADIDRDGRLDAVSGRTWYRNEGNGPSTAYRVTTLENGADPRFDDQAEVDVLDVDGDGRLDVVTTLFADSLQGRLEVFFAPMDPTHVPWPSVEIDPGPLWGIHSQAVASFDGSARVQIVIGEPSAAGFGFGTNPAPEITVYRLRGGARDAAAWERTVVDTVGTLEAQVADVDGDGHLDIIGHDGDLAGTTPGVISWWQNTTAGPATTSTTTTLPSAGACTSFSCACPTPAAAPCAGDRMPGPIRRGLARACAFVARGRKPDRVLARIARRAARAGRRGRISPACAAAITAFPAER